MTPTFRFCFTFEFYFPKEPEGKTFSLQKVKLARDKDRITQNPVNKKMNCRKKTRRTTRVQYTKTVAIKEWNRKYGYMNQFFDLCYFCCCEINRLLLKYGKQFLIESRANSRNAINKVKLVKIDERFSHSLACYR